MIPHEPCQEALRNTRLGQRFKLHSNFLCAGGEEGRDSCKVGSEQPTMRSDDLIFQGDGGGPLVCYRQDGTYSLMGIVAWGIECGKKGIPGVYVDVRKYLDWIVSHTGREMTYYHSPASNYNQKR